MIKLTKYILPSYWASYLINGDESGMVNGDKERADKFLNDNNLPSPVDCSEESFFCGHNDAGTLAGDCLEYSFLAP